MAVAALVFPRASPRLLRAHLPPGATVVAIDAGAETLRAAGMTPHRIVGDMDSVSPDTLAHYQDKGVPLERHPPEKRDTDAALALAGLQREARHDEVVFLGPGGGRVDHALANLHLLASASLWTRARAVDDDALTWIATPERPLTLHLPEGSVLSVLPWDARCDGVTYAGLRYHLDDATMETGDPYGVSNVCLAAPQRVQVRRGRLLVVQPLAPPLDDS